MFWSDCMTLVTSWPGLWEIPKRVQSQTFLKVTQLAGIKLNWLIIWHLLTPDRMPSLVLCRKLLIFPIHWSITPYGKIYSYVLLIRLRKSRIKFPNCFIPYPSTTLLTALPICRICGVAHEKGGLNTEQPSKSSRLMLDLLGTSPAETALLYARNCE